MSFPTTHWSVLAKATLHGETQARAALEELCQRYWSPVQQFIRARGIADAEAKDLTQEFMLHVIEKSLFARADRLRGQFRSFLLGALVRFLADASDRRNALKRGGAVQHVPVDTPEMADQLAAARAEPGLAVFDREWALTILETALLRIRAQYAEMHRESAFGILKDFLPGGKGASSYDTAAAQLGLSPPAFKSEVHRLRARFRELVRAEVARTVSAPHEIEAEMAHLQQILMDKSSEFGSRKET